MDFNELKKFYIKSKNYAKERLKKNLDEDNLGVAKYLSGYLDGLYMMYREIESNEEAFEKQSSKKPLLNSFSDGGEYLCPICNERLLYSDEVPTVHDSFCSRCGQEIDWSEADDCF